MPSTALPAKVRKPPAGLRANVATALEFLAGGVEEGAVRRKRHVERAVETKNAGHAIDVDFPEGEETIARIAGEKGHRVVGITGHVDVGGRSARW